MQSRRRILHQPIMQTVPLVDMEVAKLKFIMIDEHLYSINYVCSWMLAFILSGVNVWGYKCFISSINLCGN